MALPTLTCVAPWAIAVTGYFGTTFTVSQVGDDTVISMDGGAQMILVGVQASSLPDGWLFAA